MKGYQTYWRKSPHHKWVRSIETEYDFRREADMNSILGWMMSQGNFDGQVAYQTIDIVGGIRPNDLVSHNTKMDEIRSPLMGIFPKKEKVQ